MFNFSVKVFLSKQLQKHKEILVFIFIDTHENITQPQYAVKDLLRKIDREHFLIYIHEDEDMFFIGKILGKTIILKSTKPFYAFCRSINVSGKMKRGFI